MEEAAFVMAMDWVVGGIQIKHDFHRRLGVGIAEQIDDQVLDAGCIMAEFAAVVSQLSDAAADLRHHRQESLHIEFLPL